MRFHASSTVPALAILLPLSASVHASALASRQSSGSVNDFVLGQLCNSVTGPGIDPTITICTAQIVAQDTDGNTLASGNIGTTQNVGQDAVPDFCTAYASELNGGTVSLTISGTEYDFTFSPCSSDEQNIAVTETTGGSSTTLNFFATTSVSVAENPAAGVFHSSFLVDV